MNGSQFVGRSDKGLLILALCLACRQVLKGCYYRDDCCCCYCLVTQVCLTLCDRIDCSLPGSSVHGIFQAPPLEWGAIAFSDLDSILKSRDITLPKKVHLVKAMVFPVVMYGRESWTVKKAECQRVDAFELWCWRRLLRVPWTARRSNQSIVEEISPGISLEGMMLKLKLQYFGHLM